MARTIPTDFASIETADTGTSRAILETIEGYLAGNAHYLYAYHRPVQIRTTFRSDAETTSGIQPYVKGRNASSAEVSALWCIEPPGAPFDEWFIYALVENTSTTDAATLRFDIASDPHPATSVEISVDANTSAWTIATETLEIDNTQTTDTIRMWAINGAGGELRVHHVMIFPRSVTSIPAGTNTQSGHVFVPIDDDETAQDSALSVRLRRRMHGNLYHIWRTRPGMALAFSDDTHYRAGAQAFTTTSSEYENVIRVPIFVPRDTTGLRWALFARKTGSGVGRVRLRTASMDAGGDSPEVVDAVNSWTSPYTSNLKTYADSGASALSVSPGTEQAVTQDELIIDLQSDGSADVDLLGICAWFEVVSA